MRNSRASGAVFLDETKGWPAYSEADRNIWEQSYLSKGLQQMKDSEMTKLMFSSTSYKFLEYEKWIKTVGTTMKGLHPEIGRYWRAVCTYAERTYEKYLNDLSFTRVSIFPSEAVARTPIEERIESRLKVMLTNILPQSIVRQCDDREDASCAQILYRDIVFAGPASKEDFLRMIETLTKPRKIELEKPYN